MSQTIQVQVERKYMTQPEAEQVKKVLMSKQKFHRDCLQTPLLAQAIAELPLVHTLRMCGSGAVQQVARTLCVVRMRTMDR